MLNAGVRVRLVPVIDNGRFRIASWGSGRSRFGVRLRALATTLPLGANAVRVWVDKIASSTLNVGLRHEVRLDDQVVAKSGYVGENRQPEVRLTALTRCHTTNDLRAVIQCLLGMERALVSSETLANHSCRAVDQYAHFLLRPLRLLLQRLFEPHHSNRPPQ